jgi:hypothetical protein
VQFKFTKVLSQATQLDTYKVSPGPSIWADINAIPCHYPLTISRGGGSPSQHFWVQAGSSAIVDSVLDGYKGTICAYGQTGSGKTYTMTGTSPLILYPSTCLPNRS